VEQPAWLIQILTATRCRYLIVKERRSRRGLVRGKAREIQIADGLRRINVKGGGGWKKTRRKRQ
jgi:hypothetical protein